MATLDGKKFFWDANTNAVSWPSKKAQESVGPKMVVDVVTDQKVVQKESEKVAK